MKSPLVPNILSALVLFLLACCSDQSPSISGDQKNYSPAVLQENLMMRSFTEKHPLLTILKYAEADLDNNGQDDLIIIYQVAKEQNEMCVLLHQGSELIESNAVPAPVSDQIIQFKNIDNKPPLEFILQGRKGPKVGYAIFRVEDGRLEDLFGQGMEDCC